MKRIRITIESVERDFVSGWEPESINIKVDPPDSFFSGENAGEIAREVVRRFFRFQEIPTDNEGPQPGPKPDHVLADSYGRLDLKDPTFGVDDVVEAVSRAEAPDIPQPRDAELLAYGNRNRLMALDQGDSVRFLIFTGSNGGRFVESFQVDKEWSGAQFLHRVLTQTEPGLTDEKKP